MAVLLETRGLTKTFGDFRANDDVSIAISPGEVLGIVGENGAGKSTLVKMIAGAISPDSGMIMLSSSPLVMHSPADSERAGISLVYQHFNLIEEMTVAENLLLGQSGMRRGRLDFEKLRPKFQHVADLLGSGLDFGARVATLSVGGRQQVELVKALLGRPRLLILDEPTAVLPPHERDRLLDFVRRLKENGTATILISHKLDDLFGTCDRVVVMRSGKIVGESDLRNDSRADLVRMIVGAELPTSEIRRGKPGAPILSVSGLNVRRADGFLAVRNGNFTLHAGEIIGLCGVEGNGQTELMLALAGMLPVSDGDISYAIDAKSIAVCENAAELRDAGVAHIPEDRLRHAVVPGYSLAANWLLGKLHDRSLIRWNFLRGREVARQTAQAIESNQIRAAGPFARMSSLSGGNQQKFVIGRELADSPAVILAGNPTRGLDLRTVQAIRMRLEREREQGAGIIFLSADLSEIWDLADRVMVMARGHLHGPVPTQETSLGEVGSWMTGT